MLKEDALIAPTFLQSAAIRLWNPPRHAMAYHGHCLRMLNRALSCELGHSRRNGTRSWPCTDQCLHVRLQCSGRPNRSVPMQTQQPMASLQQYTVCMCMAYFATWPGCYGRRIHASQGTVTVGVLSCQRRRQRLVQSHSPFADTVAVRYRCR